MVDRPPPRRIGHRLFVAGAGLLTGLFGWVATSPRLLVHINWDAGSFISNIASGSARWSSTPWNSHFGIQYLYMVFFWAARLAGGTCIDGARFLDALCLAAIAAVLDPRSARTVLSGCEWISPAAQRTLAQRGGKP